MRRDEVDRRPRPAAAAVEQVRRAGQPGGKLGKLAFVTLPEAPGGVSELVIPLRPAGREVPDLVAAGAAVPRLGNQLDLAEQGILAHRIEEAAALVEARGLPPQDGGEVEAEAVDVHFLRPIAQGVADEADGLQVAQIERVAGTGIVDVVALVLGQAIVAGIVDTLERQRRTELIAFGGVVVDHVHEDLEAFRVHGLDHVAEFVAVATRQIAALGREEGQRVVAPVIAQALFQQIVVVQIGVDRQQLHGGHTQAVDVIEHGRLGEAGTGSTHVLAYLGMALGITAHVGLVNDRAVPGREQALIPFPVIGVFHHHGFGHERCAVTFIEAEVAVGVADGVAVKLIRPGQVAIDLACVGVEQQLMVVEAVAFGRGVRPMHPVAIALAWLYLGEIAVPDLVGVLG